MPHEPWNFQVKCVKLNDLGIDASKRLGMVIAQPDYELVPDGDPPLRLSCEFRENQISVIEQAFDIRAFESKERQVPFPFLLFPEAAIPVREPDGLSCVRTKMEHAHEDEDIVFIGGLEGLTTQETRGLVESYCPGESGTRPAYGPGAFVNLCVIAVKPARGSLSWNFQAKLRPSQWEQPRNMACGQRLLYFCANNVAFICQICFDHIAAEGEESLNTALVEKLVSIPQPTASTLDYVFVPQSNPKPQQMRQSTGQLLNQQHRRLKNDMAVVVVVNKAAGDQEALTYGRSGLHYRAKRWQVPKQDLGPKGYELFTTGDVTSAVFRKRTSAIHAATLLPAGHNIGDRGNPRQPLENPRSYLLTETCDFAPCSCLPGTRCPVGSFVECDCLPCKLRDSLLRKLPNTDRTRWSASDSEQSGRLATHYGEIRRALVGLSCRRAGELLDLFFVGREGRKQNPDTWTSELEGDAVKELASAMSILRERGEFHFDTQRRWTGVLQRSFAIAMLDGEKLRHCKDVATNYLQAFDEYSPDARPFPLLIVAVRSTGRVDPIVQPFEPDYTQPRRRTAISETSPYQPARRRVFLCNDDLFEEARRAPVLADYLACKMGVMDE